VVFNGSFYLFFRKRELLENCRRALKPGGKIQLADLILEPGAENIGSIYSELWPGGIGSVMNRETLISLLEEAGFWNIRVHPLGYRIHPWIASICIQGERR
jgi:SAM-dependent methyltransferase